MTQCSTFSSKSISRYYRVLQVYISILSYRTTNVNWYLFVQQGLDHSVVPILSGNVKDRRSVLNRTNRHKEVKH